LVVDSTKAKQVKKYILDAKQKGYSPGKIRRALVKSGINPNNFSKEIGVVSSSLLKNPKFWGIVVLVLFVLGVTGVLLFVGNDPASDREVVSPDSNPLGIEDNDLVDISNGCDYNADCAIGEKCSSGVCVDKGPEPSCGDGRCEIGEESCLIDCPCLLDVDCGVGFTCDAQGVCHEIQSKSGGGNGGSPGGDGGSGDSGVEDQGTDSQDVVEICENSIDDDGDGLVDNGGCSLDGISVVAKCGCDLNQDSILTEGEYGSWASFVADGVIGCPGIYICSEDDGASYFSGEPQIDAQGNPVDEGYCVDSGVYYVGDSDCVTDVYCIDGQGNPDNGLCQEGEFCSADTTFCEELVEDFGLCEKIEDCDQGEVCSVQGLCEAAADNQGVVCLNAAGELDDSLCNNNEECRAPGVCEEKGDAVCENHLDCVGAGACSDGICVPCLETDDAGDVYTRGDISGVDYESGEQVVTTDYCGQVGELHEFYCNQGLFVSEFVSFCDDGEMCSQGACVDDGIEEVYTLAFENIEMNLIDYTEVQLVSGVVIDDPEANEELFEMEIVGELIEVYDVDGNPLGSFDPIDCTDSGSLAGKVTAGKVEYLSCSIDVRELELIYESEPLAYSFSISGRVIAEPKDESYKSGDSIFEYHFNMENYGLILPVSDAVCLAVLPSCADGVDNDRDLLVDLADPDCVSWSGNTEGDAECIDTRDCIDLSDPRSLIRECILGSCVDREVADYKLDILNVEKSTIIADTLGVDAKITLLGEVEADVGYAVSLDDEEINFYDIDGAKIDRSVPMAPCIDVVGDIMVGEVKEGTCDAYVGGLTELVSDETLGIDSFVFSGTLELRPTRVSPFDLEDVRTDMEGFSYTYTVEEYLDIIDVESCPVIEIGIDAINIKAGDSVHVDEFEITITPGYEYEVRWAFGDEWHTSGDDVGEHLFSVLYAEGGCYVEQPFKVEVLPNACPVVVELFADNTQTILDGDDLELRSFFEVTDDDPDRIVYSFDPTDIEVGPYGLYTVAAGGVDIGEHVVGVTISDGDIVCDYETDVIVIVEEVAEANSCPTLVPFVGNVLNVMEGEPIDFVAELSIEDIDGDLLIINLPLFPDAEDGYVEGEDVTEGTFKTSIEYGDGICSDVYELLLVVEGINNCPHITLESQIVIEGDLLEIEYTIEDDEGNPYTIRFESEAESLGFDTEDGTWQTEEGDVGEYLTFLFVDEPLCGDERDYDFEVIVKAPACRDDIDNDGDGLTDYDGSEGGDELDRDPGCTNLEDRSEAAPYSTYLAVCDVPEGTGCGTETDCQYPNYFDQAGVLDGQGLCLAECRTDRECINLFGDNFECGGVTSSWGYSGAGGVTLDSEKVGDNYCLRKNDCRDSDAPAEGNKNTRFKGVHLIDQQEKGFVVGYDSLYLAQTQIILDECNADIFDTYCNEDETVGRAIDRCYTGPDLAVWDSSLCRDASGVDDPSYKWCEFTAPRNGGDGYPDGYLDEPALAPSLEEEKKENIFTKIFSWILFRG
jgi:hypothetical protein